MEAALGRARYLADPATALSTWLALKMKRPLLLEGPAGVGKTDLARAAAEALGRPVIRLQCYEGLDEAKALYEWDYAKQMLYTQLLRDVVAREVVGAESIAGAAALVVKSEASFFGEHFLIARPLLAALKSPTPVVLLIDEVDRADPEFEAFLLEILSELQVTIPELGTVKADPDDPPLVLLTTNGTREMTEALRRRCLHAFLDYPPPSREIAILKLAIPGIEHRLAALMVAFIDGLRALDLRKAPAISETIDWARAVLLLGGNGLDRALVKDTLGLLLKHQSDRTDVEPKIEKLLAAADQAAGVA
jgi:MoxR-like ATPase